MNHGNATNGRSEHSRPGDAWDELLSAYVDGEVTAGERLAVEMRLQADPAARRALAELRELSAAIRSLPREPAPPELHAAAMKRAEQRSLLGTAAIGRKNRLAQSRWIVGLLTMTAGVVLIGTAAQLGWWSQSSPDATPDSSMLVAHFDIPSNAPVEDSMSRTVMLRGASNAPLGDVALRTADMDDNGDGRSENLFAAADRAKDAAAPRDAVREGTTLGLSMAGRPVAEAAGVVNGTAVAAADDYGLERLESWQEVQPYLHLLSQNTSAVANVDLTVVDTRQALDQFEVLLMQNGVMVTKSLDQPVAAVTVNADAAADGLGMQAAKLSDVRRQAAQKSEAADVSRYAMYVESDGEPVTKALEAMIRQRQLLAVKLQPPLEAWPENAENAPPEMSQGTGIGGFRNRYTAEDQQTAYWYARQSSEDAPVSAELGVSNLALADAWAQLPQQGVSAGLVAQGMGGGASRGAGEADRKLTENESNVALNYGQRVQLQTPEPANWLKEIQDQQNGVSNTVALEDLQFQERLRYSGNSAINSMRNMTRNFRAAAPNSVRVLFILQPAAESSAPTSISAPTTTPAPVAAPRAEPASPNGR